jgi:quinol monooxygenase YgiN
MLSVMYQITVELKENKVDEFVRNLHSLWFKFLKEETCLSYRVYRELEKENTFCIIAKFVNHDDMENHFKTQEFGVLVGASRVLGKELKMVISEVVAKGGSDLAKSKLAGQC